MFPKILHPAFLAGAVFGPRNGLGQVRILAAFVALWLAEAGETTSAATIQAGDVTAALGPTFFVDDATNGGSDADINQPTVTSYNRSFAGLLTPAQGPVRIALTGFGFAAHTSATANDATTLSVTFTYLGADEAVGGGDDVVVGSASGAYGFTVGGEYVFAFDSPLVADLVITGTRFRIQLAPVNAGGNGSLKIKTGPLTYETSSGPKLSVAGFVAPQRVNLALFQPVTTSSVSGQRLASYVTDGNAGNDNRWQSTGSGPHWARVDFPFPVEVGSAQVFTGVDDTNAQAGFRIQYLSGATWVDAPGAVITGNTDIERNIVFTTPVTASSFRIYSTDGTVRVRELALFPPNGAAGFPLGTDVRLNLAQQRPAVANARSTGNFALLAVDGRVNKDSKWQTTTAGASSLEIDLRVSTKIGSAHLYSGSPGVPPLADFILKHWDGTTWQDIPGANVTGNTTGDLVLPFTTPVTTSRVRLEFTNPGISSVRELCIFQANIGNAGYPLGAGVTGAPPSTAKADDYTDSFYQILNPASNRFITITTSGQPALDAPGLTTSSGQYQILPNLSTGTYRLRHRATGNCLSGASLSKTPGQPLTDAPYSAMPHQDWILDPLEGGTFQLINQWSGLAIDLQDGATSAGTPLVQNTANGSASQRWRLDFSAGFPKKGVGGTGRASTFLANWAYNWGLANSNTLPAGTFFHPMQWGDFNWNYDTTAASTWKLYPAWRTAGHPLHLLGFNEPDKFDQSGRSLDQTNPQTEAAFSAQRSMEEAIVMWPRLMAMDQPLVSPAPANMNGGWLADFYTNANTLGYRVDYTALHSYPGPSGGSSDGLVNTLQAGFNNWGRPIWLTEFSFVNWDGTGTWSEEDNYNCLAEFLWRAESLPWLRKYALFVFTESDGGPNNPGSPAPPQPWSAVGPRSNAIDIDGNLTAFGKLYAAWDNDAAVRTGKRYFIHNKDTRKRLASNAGQTTAAARNIRNDSLITEWTLVSTGANNRYHLVSQSDGRRLSFTSGGSVVLDPPGTTGTAVEWSLTETQHGWFYLGHPATSRRLKMAYNNSTSTATYTMEATSNTTDSVQWRFIVPMPAPEWSGTASNDWTNSSNWLPAEIPSTGKQVVFGSSSTQNLGTQLNQDFSISGLHLKAPEGSVSVGGTHILSIGADGIDLSAATRDLSISAPLVLGSAQTWNIAYGRTLAVHGGVSGPFALSISGAGVVSLGAAIDPRLPLTIAAGGTVRMDTSGVLASGATAVAPTVSGTLDLNGTNQSVNSLGGTGIIDNGAAGTAQLTVGHNDATVTLNTLLQDSGGNLALVKTGAGALILPAASTFAGGLTNNGTGNVVPQNQSAFGTGPVVMNGATIYPTLTSYTFANPLNLNDATLRIGGSSGKTIIWNGSVTITGNSFIQCDGGTGGITLAGDVHIDGGTLHSAPNNTSNTISAPISGTGTVMAATFSNGTLHLNAANPFSGAYRSSLGTIRIGHPDALQQGTLDMNAADSGSVNLNNLNAVIGALTGSRPLNLGSGAVSIGNNHLDTTYSGVLSGSGSLVKSGNGTLTLAGANTYAGTTTVASGTLALAASHALPATAVSIANATLDVAGNVTDSTGTLDVTHPAAAIRLGTGATIVFANSSGIDWTGGALDITGTFISGSSIRFGTHGGGLTPTQLGLITLDGAAAPFALDAAGFLIIPATSSYDSWAAQITDPALRDRGDDADGDGFNNLSEFLFGTPPVAGNGSPVSVSNNGSTVTLRWLQRESGASYTLQQSPTLTAASWTTVTSPVPAPDLNQNDAPTGYDYFIVTLPAGGTSLFHRIAAMEN